jgi:hypothetical protein
LPLNWRFTVLSWKTFVKAEKLRQALGERHFGHFDRDAVHLHGPVENEAEPMPAATGGQQLAHEGKETTSFVLSCRIERDRSSGNLTPTIKAE